MLLVVDYFVKTVEHGKHQQSAGFSFLRKSLHLVNEDWTSLNFHEKVGH